MFTLKNLVLKGVATLFVVTNSLSAANNYSLAFEKSIYFYECQVSGQKPSWNRCEWRGNSATNDGKDVGVDLTGGWYDAGDHVKFGFPLAYTATMLALGYVEYEDVYVKQGQKENFLNNLRFVNDYFIKCHTSKFELWGQVGNSHLDHGWWGPAEKMTMERPAYKIDTQKPGSDLAGETAAAMAASSIVFKKSNDEAYAQKLLKHAVELYEFAEKYPKKYHESIDNAQGCYQSWSGWYDELVWAGIWIYLASKDVSYLEKAERYYDSLGVENGTTYKKFKWTHCWDDKGYGSYVYLARLTGKEKYKTDAERWLDFWTCGFESFKVPYTPGGLAWVDRWGVLRYAANTSLFALLYSDYLRGTNGDQVKIKRYSDFGISQIDYILGKNPSNRSFVCGVGNNPPVNPHHRSAHGSDKFVITDPVNNRFKLDGALVGGPDQTDKYTDDRNNYEMNEVACDYNAAFTSVLARVIGGESAGNNNITSIESIQKLPDQDQISVNIRPVNNQEIMCALTLPKSSPVTVSLYGIDGKKIACLDNKTFTSGTHSLHYALPASMKSTCIIMVKTGQCSFSKMVTLF
jgi:endoglucanase